MEEFTVFTVIVPPLLPELGEMVRKLGAVIVNAFPLGLAKLKVADLVSDLLFYQFELQFINISGDVIIF